MARRKKPNEKLTYVSIGVLNLCVALMFITVLWPHPPTQTLAVTYPVVISRALKEPPKAESIIGTPTRVEVPAVGIDSTVRAGDYDTQSKTWSIDTTSAFYATATVPVNNTNGTTLIYGHAGWGIFETLPAAQAEAEARISTSEGYTFIYTFESNRQVEPTDTSFMTSSGPPQLVLQTCSGAFDTYRTLVTFRLKGIVSYG